MWCFSIRRTMRSKSMRFTLGLLGGDAAGLLADEALVIAEHRRKEKLNTQYGLLSRARLLEQGDAGLSFYALQRS